MIYHLLLGSNQDDPARQLDLARERLALLPQLRIVRASEKLKNKAYGFTEQPDFYNQVLEIDTALLPLELLRLLQKVELEMGRKREFKWGPRNIDLDILLAEDLVLDTPDLAIPHYDLLNRHFALQLLCDVAPNAVHPIENKSICQLLDELKQKGDIQMKALAAIVLAAGKGTRMNSEKAKVTFPIAEKAMVQRVVDTALAMDCARISVVVGWQKESVMQSILPDARISFCEQSEQLGTGHAVQMAEADLKDFDGDLIILSGDVPLLGKKTLERLQKQHRETNAAVTVLTAVLEDAGKYGRMLRDENGQIRGIVEYKDATPQELMIGEFNTGIYIFDKKALFEALSQIKNNNEQGEYYLTDTLAILHQNQQKVESVILEDLIEVSGVNSQEQLAALEEQYVDKTRKKWLNQGVMMHNPATIYIGDDVQLSPDTELGQGVILRGKCQLGKRVCIGDYTIVEDSTVAEDCRLKGHNVVSGSNLKSNLDYGARYIKDTLYE